MKIRITGTKEECVLAQYFYQNLADNDHTIKSASISGLYPNRNSVNVYRVYVDIECSSEHVSAACRQLEGGKNVKH